MERNRQTFEWKFKFKIAMDKRELRELACESKEAVFAVNGQICCRYAAFVIYYII